MILALPGMIFSTAATYDEDPEGFMVCDGRELVIDDHPVLYAAIRDKWNTTGDGITTFNIPGASGRMPVFSGQGNTAEGGVPGTDRELGDTGGAETHTLTVDEMPEHGHSGSVASAGAHSHTIAGGSGQPGSSRVHGTSDSGDTYNTNSDGEHTHALTISNTGSGQAHENMPPFIVFTALIKT